MVAQYSTDLVGAVDMLQEQVLAAYDKMGQPDGREWAERSALAALGIEPLSDVLKKAGPTGVSARLLYGASKVSNDDSLRVAAGNALSRVLEAEGMTQEEIPAAIRVLDEQIKRDAKRLRSSRGESNQGYMWRIG